MTTLRTILTRAMRMTRARPVGDDPDATEMTAALEEAQSMFLVFPIRRLTSVLVEANYTAKENERVLNTSGGAITVTLPETITTDGSERAVYNGAIVEVSGTTVERYIYIAELGAWYYAEPYHQQYLAKNPNGYCGIGGTGVSCPIGTRA